MVDLDEDIGLVVEGDIPSLWQWGHSRAAAMYHHRGSCTGRCSSNRAVLVSGMSAFCLGSFTNCSGAILDDGDGSPLRGQLGVYCAPSADWVIKVNGG